MLKRISRQCVYIAFYAVIASSLILSLNAAFAAPLPVSAALEQDAGIRQQHLCAARAAARSASMAKAANGSEMLAGTWLTADGSTKVRFEPCEGKICGRIVWLREPIDPSTGRAWRDDKNDSRELQQRLLIGVSIISNLNASGEGRWSGALYNPLDGRTYDGTLRQLDDSKIELSGCVFKVLCKHEVWTRSP
jgi:uncharacterized protein (DUF2147 family)